MMMETPEVQITQVIGSDSENRGTVDHRRRMPKNFLRSDEDSKEVMQNICVPLWETNGHSSKN